jgi:hypothetical protein
MKNLLLPLFTLLSISAFAQSDNELLPYNPDFDGDGSIGSPDLLGFLPTFGEAFQPEGILPVEFGGTGETTVDGIKSLIEVTVFEDITPVGQQNSAGLVQGDVVITGTSTQGDGCAATGNYANASGRFSLATGNYSNASNQNCNATGICSFTFSVRTNPTSVTVLV